MMKESRPAMMMPKMMKNRRGLVWLLGLSGDADGGSDDATGDPADVTGGSIDTQMQETARR
jgi:hypothetical protein